MKRLSIIAIAIVFLGFTGCEYYDEKGGGTTIQGGKTQELAAGTPYCYVGTSLLEVPMGGSFSIIYRADRATSGTVNFNGQILPVTFDPANASSPVTIPVSASMTAGNYQIFGEAIAEDGSSKGTCMASVLTFDPNDPARRRQESDIELMRKLLEDFLVKQGGGGTTCTAEADAAFCTRLGLTCGVFTGADNCGTSRSANCGTCTASQTCTDNACVDAGGGGGGCTAETDAAFCSRLVKDCGAVTAPDNCGTARTASCGTCTASQTCTDNACVAVGGGGGACTAETDVAFCSRVAKNCGSVTGTDNCSAPRTVASCGTCGGGQTCSAENICVAAGGGGGGDGGGGGADTTPPTVVSTVPANNGTRQPNTSPITVTFSEALNPGTVNNSRYQVSKVSSATALIGTPVTGTIAPQTGNTQFRFTPASNLASDSHFLVKLSPQIADVAGNTLAAEYTFRFKTTACGSGKGQTPCPAAGGGGGGDGSGKGETPSGGGGGSDAAIAEAEAYWNNCTSTGGTVGSGMCTCPSGKTWNTETGNCDAPTPTTVTGIKIRFQTGNHDDSGTDDGTLMFEMSGDPNFNDPDRFRAYFHDEDPDYLELNNGDFEEIDFAGHPELLDPSSKDLGDLVYPTDFQYMRIASSPTDALSGAWFIAGLEVLVRLANGEYVTIYRNPCLYRWIEKEGSHNYFSPISIVHDQAWCFYFDTPIAGRTNSSVNAFVRTVSGQTVTEDALTWANSYTPSSGPRPILTQDSPHQTFKLNLDWIDFGGTCEDCGGATLTDWNGTNTNYGAKQSFGVTVYDAHGKLDAEKYKFFIVGTDDWTLHYYRVYSFKPGGSAFIDNGSCLYADGTPNVVLGPDTSVQWPPANGEYNSTSTTTCPTLTDIEFRDGVFAFGVNECIGDCSN